MLQIDHFMGALYECNKSFRCSRKKIMIIVKKEAKTKDGVLHIELPNEFKDKPLEITVRLKRDIEAEICADRIKIDTRRWRFNREEVYER